MEKLALPGSSLYFGVATGFSRTFQGFIRDLGEAKSKYDGDKIIKRELSRLKEAITLPSLSLREKKENMMRLIYGHLLGHDVAFGNIYVIKLAEQANLLEKRVGYLTLSLLLNESHEMTLLLMNTIRKDLLSKNLLIKSFGLSAAARLVSKGMLPMVLDVVRKLVNHDKEIIRTKAVVVMCKFHLMDPETVKLNESLEKRLCDHDAGVIGAVINGYLLLVKEDRLRCRSVTAPLVSIVKQILESRIPSDFNFYGVPAPWILINGLQVLAELGADDLSSSQEMYEILGLCIEKMPIDSTIGCAVTYECMKTITSIYPDPFMINMVINRLAPFFASTNNNMKYIGINMLSKLISIDIRYADGYQSTVIDSLNDSDETLKRKTLDLLYQMTNSNNVDVVCSKLLSHLRSTVDSFFRTNLVTRITKLADRFAPDDFWYLRTINDVLEVGGNVVNPEIAYNVMRLIGEGSEDEDVSKAFIKECLTDYMERIDKPSLPDILIQLASWVIGEYACSSGLYNAEDVLDKLFVLLRQKHSDPYTRSWILSAMIKVHGQASEVPNHVIDGLRRCSEEMDSDLRQRCSEAIAIATVSADLSQVVPVDASCEDIEVESSLSFLDDVTQKQISEGAPSYNPEWRRSEAVNRTTNDQPAALGLNFTPYTLKSNKEKRTRERKEEEVTTTETRPPTVLASSGTEKPKLWTSSGYMFKERLDSTSTDVSDSTSEAESVREENSNPDEVAVDNTVLQFVPQSHADNEKQRLVAALFGGSSSAATNVYTTYPKTNPMTHNRDLNRDQRSEPVINLETSNRGKEFEEVSTVRRINSAEPVDFLSIDELLMHHEGIKDSQNSAPNLLHETIEESGQVHKATVSESLPDELSDPVDTSASGALMPSTTTVDLISSSIEMNDSAGQQYQRKDLASDENIRISILKEEKPTELSIVLYITNQTPGNIHQGTLTIKAMSNLDFRLNHSEEMTVTYDVISPRRTIQCTLDVRYKSPAQNMTISGEFSYRDKAYNRKLLLVKHELSYLELVRPLQIDAADFRDRWLTVGLLELSKSLQVGTLGSEELMETLHAERHIFVVDADHHGNEAEILAAGTLHGKCTLLFYFHLKPTSLKVLLRSDNNLLNQYMYHAIEGILELNS